MHNLLDCYFPEFLYVFRGSTGKAVLQLLLQGYLSHEIKRVSKKALVSEIKTAVKRVVGIQVGVNMAKEELTFLTD